MKVRTNAERLQRKGYRQLCPHSAIVGDQATVSAIAPTNGIVRLPDRPKFRAPRRCRHEPQMDRLFDPKQPGKILHAHSSPMNVVVSGRAVFSRARTGCQYRAFFTQWDSYRTSHAILANRGSFPLN